MNISYKSSNIMKIPERFSIFGRWDHRTLCIGANAMRITPNKEEEQSRRFFVTSNFILLDLLHGDSDISFTG
jgi:hypothetical protein